MKVVIYYSKTPKIRIIFNKINILYFGKSDVIFLSFLVFKLGETVDKEIIGIYNTYSFLI